MNTISNYLPLLIGVLYLLIHIGSIIAKEVQKRRVADRKREQLDRQRAMEANFRTPAHDPRMGVGSQMQIDPVGAHTAARTAPPVITGAERVSIPAQRTTPASRQDELARRRQEQLEMLRARRDQQTAVRMGRQQQVRTPAQPPIAPTRIEPREIDTLQVQRENERRAAEEARQRAERQARAQRQREIQQRVQRLTAKAKAAPVSHAIDARSIEADQVEPLHRESRRLQSLRNRLHDKTTLRELILLREIFDPPVSVRE